MKTPLKIWALVSVICIGTITMIGMSSPGEPALVTSARSESSPPDPLFASTPSPGLAMATAHSGSHSIQDKEKLSFNADVRPILAKKCFACHGPDEKQRQSGLRLDQRAAALESEAFVPGDVDESELVKRIFSDDSDVLMPPSHVEKPLDESEKEILKRWIAEGAEYETHWAFIPPVSPALPSIKNRGWLQNPIDNFVLKKLEDRQLAPAEQADRYTLVRRLYLDLVGVSPTPEQADAFFNSKDKDAYAKLVDQLLASPKYGERWARPWLDLARYSDTNGYEKDLPRSIWPYRDWVIRALNDDLPYDQFSIYQMAGDMLPNPTNDQMIATGFHRNTMLNEEGGIDPFEFRFLAMVDRVATTGTVWMGLTMGCAQCHTHKFDPITHTDFYSMMALMNSVEEPDYQVVDQEWSKKRADIEKQIKEIESSLADKFPIGENAEGDPEPVARKKNYEIEFSKWINSIEEKIVDWNIARPATMKTNNPRLKQLDDGSIFASGDITRKDLFEFAFDLQDLDLKGDPITAIRIEAVPDSRLPGGGPGRAYYEGRKGDFFVSEVDAWVDGGEIEFGNVSDSYGETIVEGKPNLVIDGDRTSGWQPDAHEAERLQLVLRLEKPIATGKQLKLDLLFERHYAASLGRFRFAFTTQADAVAGNLPNDIEELIKIKGRDQWTEEELAKMRRFFEMNTPILQRDRAPLVMLKRRLPEPIQTLVMQERPKDHRRETFRHHRGEFLSPRETVQPAIPQAMLKEGAEHPTDRLQFARWLVSDSNPLAARVAVNRAWREFFGSGLLRSNGDFGVQSEPPTHPELLDWLAVDFVRQGWSIKKLHKQIVMSATYRQSSKVDSKQFELDPENRLLARGPRFRVSGEVFRDLVLTSTGILTEKMYGPGVRPPQPASVVALAYGKEPWNPSNGANRYRRSIYTYHKRTAPFAAYTVFDAPSGENCVTRRNRSNTPLQALTVLNDEMYLEMVRKLGVETEKLKLSDQESVRHLFRRFLIRQPSDTELGTLTRYYKKQLKRISSGNLDPKKINHRVGDTDKGAALTMVARVILNLDETITKQ